MQMMMSSFSLRLFYSLWMDGWMYIRFADIFCVKQFVSQGFNQRENRENMVVRQLSGWAYRIENNPVQFLGSTTFLYIYLFAAE